MSGVENNQSTGAPILISIPNKDQRSKDYSSLEKIFRPSHADFTYHSKYGIRHVSGGGRSSARITAGMVAAGAIAKSILKKELDITILSYVSQIKHIKTQINPLDVTFDQVESNIVRCPDKTIATEMIKLIEKTRKNGNSVGGILQCVVQNMPVGLGEPVFDKLEADLAKACLSINATKGFEIGSGFDGTLYYGSEHNDTFIKDEKGKVITQTNNSGGVQGGISNGMPLLFRIAFKPTATIMQSQHTIDKLGHAVDYQAKGRHDPCVLPRAVPIVEAMTAIVLCDHYLRNRGQTGNHSFDS